MNLLRFLAIAVLVASGCAAAPSSNSTEKSTRNRPIWLRPDAPNRHAATDATAQAPAQPAATTDEEAPAQPILSGWAYWNSVRGDSYALDEEPRFLEDSSERLSCSPEGLVNYSGNAVRYYGAVRVSEPFRERLERFEQLVADTAREVYGRAPRRIRHYGAYSCRTSRNRSYRVSEHALGNAIDVVGFDFGPASKADLLPEDSPKALSGAFQVRVARHWTAPEPKPHNQSAIVHARFLRELTSRLLERRDIFRSLIGPSHRGHADHFHFDMSPWRYVHL